MAAFGSSSTYIPDSYISPRLHMAPQSPSLAASLNNSKADPTSFSMPSPESLMAPRPAFADGLPSAAAFSRSPMAFAWSASTPLPW